MAPVKLGQMLAVSLARSSGTLAVIVGLLLSLAASPLAHAAPIAVAAAASPQQTFLFDLCTPGSPSWPLKVDNLCSSWGFNDPARAKQACDVIEIVRTMLGSPAFSPLRCEPDQLPPPATADARGRLLPLPLLDQRVDGVLPNRYPASVQASLLRAEGASHLWMFRHILGFAAWAPCGVLGKSLPWAVPDGWTLLDVVNVASNLATYNLPATSLPLMAVLRRNSTAALRAGCRSFLSEHAQLGFSVSATQQGPDGLTAQQHTSCAGDQLMVILRGTGSVEEWQYDFDYAMTSDESYGAGQLHRGFVGIGEQMWNNGLHSVLRKHVLQGEGTVSHITITGHSLGAATASLLAAKTQRYLARAVAASVQEQQQAQPPLQPTVSAVLFAAPNVGDEAFAADFNTRVNTRNIRYQSDIVTQAPCAKSMPVCPVSAKRKASGGAAAPAAAAAMTEDRIVEMLLGGGGGLDDDEEATIEDAPSSAAGNSSVGTSSSQASPAWTFVSYAELGGQLVLDASDMPYQQSAWKQLSLYQQDEFCDDLNTVAGLGLAVHVCSYACLLSQAAGPGVADRHNWCLLWPEGGAGHANATYCQEGARGTFPMDPIYPHMGRR